MRAVEVLLDLLLPRPPSRRAVGRAAADVDDYLREDRERHKRAMAAAARALHDAVEDTQQHLTKEKDE